MCAPDFDQVMFDADMEAFFDLAFEREREGLMTIDEIGRIFPDRLALDQEGYYDEQARLFSLTEDEEIALAYQALDEEEALAFERAREAREERWEEIQERLIRREERRRIVRLKKRLLAN